MKLLFISPHPDDVEIGCGGTVRKYVDKGHKVDLAVVVGEGDLGMVHSKQTVTFHQRQIEQKEAGSILGFENIHYLNVGPASKLDIQGLAKGCGALDEVLSISKYDMLFFPLPSFNQDHQYVWDMVLAATRPGRAVNTALFAYEQPMNCHGSQIASAINCNMYSGLSEGLFLTKCSAIMCHASQIAGREDTLSGLAGVKALAKLRGLEIEAPYAERFLPVKSFI